MEHNEMVLFDLRTNQKKENETPTKEAKENVATNDINTMGKDNRKRKSLWIKELNNAFEYFMNYFGSGPKSIACYLSKT